MNNQLHPAWFGFEPGEEVTDLALRDSLSKYMQRVNALGFVQQTIGENNDDIPPDTLNAIGWMLCDMTHEAESLMGQWAEKLKPRIVAGGEK